MKITSVSARGLLSFEDFKIDLDRRITVIVGPNGAGKSNLGRVLELVRRTVESADRTSPGLERMLQVFYGGRRSSLPDDGIEVRVEFELTDEFETQLVVAFLQAAAGSALLGNWSGTEETKIEEWVEREVTARQLAPLFHGTVVVTHRGTPDARWQVGVDFSFPRLRRREKTYRWFLRGEVHDTIVGLADLNSTAPLRHYQELADKLRGAPRPQGRPTAPGGRFAVSRMLPQRGGGVSCSLELGRTSPLRASRRFAEMVGIDPLGGPDTNRRYGFARVIATILRRGLIQTSDSRLLPTPSVSWSAPDMQPRYGGEGNLPEMLFLLKNAPADQCHRFEGVRHRFWELSQGRQLDVVASPIPPTPSTEEGGEVGLRVSPQVVVSVDPVAVGGHGPAAQVPIEFAGAGASETLLLASVLGSQAASIVVLDEPAVALHPTLQRRVMSHIRASDAQFVVITHSPYLLPLGGDQRDVRVVRFERDEKSATHPWRAEPTLLARLSKKLVAKGNEGLPFAWKAVLCEGETDVEAIRALAERLDLDLDLLNIAVIDSGGRDNLPDYVRFCSSLGIPFLAIMDGDTAKAVKNPAVKKNAQAVRAAVAKAPLGRLVEFREDIESALGVTKQKSSLVASALQTVRLDGSGPVEIKELAAQLYGLAEVAIDARPHGERRPLINSTAEPLRVPMRKEESQ